WLRGKWNQIVSDVTAWWGQMTGKVEAGGKAAADKVTSSFITPITSAITGIIAQALTWGENLMKMLGQGIANGAGDALPQHLHQVLAPCQGLGDDPGDGAGDGRDETARDLVGGGFPASLDLAGHLAPPSGHVADDLVPLAAQP